MLLLQLGKLPLHLIVHVGELSQVSLSGGQATAGRFQFSAQLLIVLLLPLIVRLSRL